MKQSRFFTFQWLFELENIAASKLGFIIIQPSLHLQTQYRLNHVCRYWQNQTECRLWGANSKTVIPERRFSEKS
ncbi:MAG: hypothetical protein CTY19_15795 [Methylomonas sp.]|nr:MAG: hypothetical protein CTY19_15795 [Methylomonas sp.]